MRETAESSFPHWATHYRAPLAVGLLLITISATLAAMVSPSWWWPYGTELPALAAIWVLLVVIVPRHSSTLCADCLTTQATTPELEVVQQLPLLRRAHHAVGQNLLERVAANVLVGWIIATWPYHEPVWAALRLTAYLLVVALYLRQAHLTYLHAVLAPWCVYCHRRSMRLTVHIVPTRKGESTDKE